MAIFLSTGYAYLETGTGALILFASLQMTIIVMSLVDGDSLTSVEWGGEISAFWGFVMLVARGVNGSPLLGFSVMSLAGIS